MINTNHITMNGIIVYIQIYIYIYIFVYDQLLSFIYYPSIPLIIPISRISSSTMNQSGILIIHINICWNIWNLNYIDMNNYWFNYIFFGQWFFTKSQKSLTKQVIDQRSLPPGSPAQVLIRLCGTTVGSKALLSYQLSPRRRGNSPGGATGKPWEGENPWENPRKVGWKSHFLDHSADFFHCPSGCQLWMSVLWWFTMLCPSVKCVNWLSWFSFTPTSTSSINPTAISTMWGPPVMFVGLDSPQ